MKTHMLYVLYKKKYQVKNFILVSNFVFSQVIQKVDVSQNDFVRS
jgi:hypothetical protein